MTGLLSARRVCVAPMMDWTDRHGRYFLRLMSRQMLLYGEMVPTAALLHGSRDRFLAYHPIERPLAMQLGGNDPADLAECARMAEDWGYDEVNLNIGCPSGRVVSGRFGACLMAEPLLVARCVEAMKGAVRIPVTVKHRIGIDQRDDYDHLASFVRSLVDAGCEAVVIHARKALLNGVSPKRNRTVPPLRHDMVHQVKRDFPTLVVVTNGGIASLDQAAAHLDHVDGVMIGRAAFDNPYLLAEVDRRFHGSTAPDPTRRDVVEGLIAYADQECAAGTRLDVIVRHVHGLFQGVPGARQWRRGLQQMLLKSNAAPRLIGDAAASALAQLRIYDRDN